MVFWQVYLFLCTLLHKSKSLYEFDHGRPRVFAFVIIWREGVGLKSMTEVQFIPTIFKTAKTQILYPNTLFSQSMIVSIGVKS